MGTKTTADENIDPEAIAPKAAAEEAVAAPEGSPAVVQIVALAEESEALPEAQTVDGPIAPAAEPVLEAKVEVTVDAAPPLATPSIRLEKKHPLAIRWMHWINFPVLATMIWSGLLIYWATRRSMAATRAQSIVPGLASGRSSGFSLNGSGAGIRSRFDFGSRDGTARLTTSRWGSGITSSSCGFSC
jgi:hypothetical protein